MGKSLLELSILILFFNYNNNTYIVPISIMLFSLALKNKNISTKKKILRLYKVYMHKVHEPTKRS